MEIFPWLRTKQNTSANDRSQPKPPHNVRFLPYRLSSVLEGSPATFGVEVEFVGDPNRVARSTYLAGLSQHATVQPRNAPAGWSVKLDASVDDGGEIVSPILRDDRRDWLALQAVFRLITDAEVFVDHRCGLHVHVGAFRLEEHPPYIEALWQICAASEDILYRLAAPWDRHRGTLHARPLSLRDEIPQYWQPNSAQKRAQHADAVNLENLLGERRTVEFRYANATMHPVVAQLQIALAVTLIEAARQAPVGKAIPYHWPYGYHRRQQTSRESDTADFERFLGVLGVQQAPLSEGLRWLFAQGTWQSAVASNEGESATEVASSRD